MKADFSTFRTPTAEKYAKQSTTVAPVKLAQRPQLEARDKVEAIWKAPRTAVLPLADAKAVAEVWSAGAAPELGALLANFPKSMKGRVRRAEERGGEGEHRRETEGRDRLGRGTPRPRLVRRAGRRPRAVAEGRRKRR